MEFKRGCIYLIFILVLINLNFLVEASTVNITYPINNTNYSNAVSILNYTATGADAKSCWYTKNNGLTNSSAVPAGTNFSISSSEGQNIFRVHCVNLFSALNNYTRYYPSAIQNVGKGLSLYSYNFTINGQNASVGDLIIAYNQNGTIVGRDAVRFEGIYGFMAVDGNNGDVINFTIVDNSTRLMYNASRSFTLSGVNYMYTSLVFDFGDVNSTNTNESSTIITFNQDTLPPNIDITYPLDGATYNFNNISINYSVSDSGLGLSSCWYTNNSGLNNYSIICNQNFTQNLTQGTYTYTIYANDSLNNLASHSHTFGISTSAPAIILNSPSSDEWFNNGLNIYFNYTAIDSDGLSSCQLWGNWTGSWQMNFSWVSPINQSMNFTILNLTEGSYIWNIWCNDTTNLGGFSVSNRTVSIDNTYPLISYGSLTSVNGANVSQSNIYVNVSFSEINFANITFNLYNNSGIVNSTTYTSMSYTINWINLAEGYYTYNVSIIDKANNKNFTIPQIINLDSTPPSLVSIIYPENTTYNVNISTLNYSTNGISCWYSNSSGYWNSSSVLSGLNFTNIISQEGSNVFTLYCNDSAGNLNSSSVTFIKDTTSPSLTVVSPQNGANQTSFVLSINFTVSDTNFNRTELRIYNSSLTLINYTNSTDSGNQIVNLSVVSDGLYTINLISYDLFSSYSSSSVNVTVDSTEPNIIISSPLNGTIYYANNSVPIFFSATDSLTSISSKWYNYNGTNYTFSILVNLNYTTLGMKNISFYANDSLNNLKSSVVYFNVTALPTTSIIPNSSSYNVSTNVSEIIVSFNTTLQEVILTNTTKQVSFDLSQLLSNGTVNIGTNNFTLITTNSTYNYTAIIPAGINITGSSDWDGKIYLPTINSTSFTAPSGSANLVINMGSSTRINFSSPVKIIIGGMAGKSAAWTSGSTTLTSISTSCTNENVSGISSGECYVNAANGVDLVIWTYHFTSFAAYTPTTTTTTTTSSSGGGGGGGGAPTGSTTYYLTDIQLNVGYNKEISSGDKFRFIIKNETHNLALETFSYNSATFNISSMFQRKTISIGEEWKINLNEDNYYDLKLKLNSINLSSNKTDISLRTITELITPLTLINNETKINKTYDYKNESLDDDNKKIINLDFINILYIILGIIVILIIILLIFIIFKKRK